VNLVFFANHERGALGDLVEAARRISALHPEIHACALTTKARVRRFVEISRLALRPTLSIEIHRIRFPHALRGVRLHRETQFNKIEEMRRLAAVGIAVPRWIEIKPETILDPEEWGPYVVVKPSNAQRGANVVIKRTSRVRFKAPEEYRAGHPGRHAPLIAQEFIYTGKYPASYRIVTFLGKPISAYRYNGRTNTALPDRFAFRSVGSGYNIVASAVGCTADSSVEPDIVDLASRAHAAFPLLPYLGIDVVRDVVSGVPYVLETNPHGFCWPLENPTMDALASFMGFHPREQFGAIDRIAETAAEAALRLAA
jgi:hypothetical protein